METYYRKRAPVYDRVYGYPERQQDLRYQQEVIPNSFAGRRVLEIAAGTGYWTQFIAKQAASVVATDLLPETLDRAKERPGLEGVEFRVMDAYRLNDIGGGYDGVFAGLWLSHVPLQRRGDFLASLQRVVTPGALIVFLDNSRAQCQRLPIVYRDPQGNTYQDRQLDDGTVHRVMKNFPTAEELIQLTGQFSRGHKFTELEHFWIFSYFAN